MDQEEFDRKMRKLKRQAKELKASDPDGERVKKVKKDIRRLQKEQETARPEGGGNLQQ